MSSSRREPLAPLVSTAVAMLLAVLIGIGVHAASRAAWSIAGIAGVVALGAMAAGFSAWRLSSAGNRAYQAASRDARLLRDAQEIAALGIWQWDLGTGRIHWSPEVFRIHGVDPSEGEPDFAALTSRLYTAEAAQVLDAAVKRCLATGEPYRLVLTTSRPDGRRGAVNANGRAVFDHRGRMVGLEGTIMDITEQAEQAARLKEREADVHLLTHAVRSASDGLMVTDAGASGAMGPRILYVNPAIEQLTGYSAAELVGNSPRMLQCPQTDRAELSRVRSAIERGVPVTAELLNRQRDGTPYWVELRIVPIPGEDGRPTHFVAIERDVTARRAHAAELRNAVNAAQSADRAKSAFLATMSHEMRTPLNGVMGFTALLRDTRVDEEQQQYIECIDGSAKALLGLVESVLDVSRIVAGRVELGSLPMDPAMLLRDVVAEQSRVAESKGLVLRAQVGDVPLVLGDAARLAQVMRSLVENAVKFTARGQVAVTLDAVRADGDASDITLVVEDTGPGMTPSELASAFDAFSQAEDWRVRRHNGVGVGLTVARHLMTLMGGSLSATSEPGRGSRFTMHVCLPHAVPEGARVAGT